MIRKIRRITRKIRKVKKTNILFGLMFIGLIISISIPTFARYKNNVYTTGEVWNGDMATSYHTGDGTSEHPFIISNGAELSYFYSQANEVDYTDTYFELSQDITLNSGMLVYDNGVKYVIDNTTYNVDAETGNYYSGVVTEEEAGSINKFYSINNFKGNFDGKFFSIHGLFITGNDNVGLFNNLQGNVSNLYLENALIYGGVTTGGIASTSNGANINNVLYRGYVIGSEDSLKKVTENLNDIQYSLHNVQEINSIDLTNRIPFDGSSISSIKLHGDYTLVGTTEAESVIKINDIPISGGQFNVDLGSSIVNSTSILTYTSSSTDAFVNITNLVLEVEYNYSISAGIVGVANNTIIKNTVNFGNIYGYSVGSGITGSIFGNSSINNSYNTGLVTSDNICGGLIGSLDNISDNISINNSYNSGNFDGAYTGGIVGNINNSSLNLNNSFNTYSISFGRINNSNIVSTNSFYTNYTDTEGSIIQGFGQLSLDNYLDKDYMIDNMLFNEYVDENDLVDNPNNIWVYKNGYLPVIYLDNSSDPIVRLNITSHYWENYKANIDTISLGSDVVFNVQSLDVSNIPKNIYYYVSNSSTLYTMDELNNLNTWIEYNNGTITISTEGSNLIYIKAIMYDGRTIYINSDLLNIDTSFPTINISVGNNNYSCYNDDVETQYLDRNYNISVSASDLISGVSSLQYIVSDGVKTTKELDGESNWVNYTTPITINDNYKHIIYVKAVDNSRHTSYANTDYILKDGYIVNSLNIGKGSNTNSNIMISNRSSINMNASYSGINEVNGKRGLISSIVLPIGTKITLYDNISHKVFEYKVIDGTNTLSEYCDVLNCSNNVVYPFELFKEIGTRDGNIYYSDSNYSNDGNVSENFDIIVDFENSIITSNYENVKFSIGLVEQGNIVRPTMTDSISDFDIISLISGNNSYAILSLTTDYNSGTINFDSTNSVNINLASNLNNKSYLSNDVFDTFYDDKFMGISIKIVDYSGAIVPKEDYKNILFRFDGNDYSPLNDNIIHINLNTINNVNNILTISTGGGSNKLSRGTYYIKISNYISDDGIYYDNTYNEISIPLYISNTNIGNDYQFDVEMDSSNRIISKKNSNVNVNYNIIQSGSLLSPKVRVSLYKKKYINENSAINQEYDLVNINNYISNNLSLFENNIYDLISEPLVYNGQDSTINNVSLNLITSNFENTGYKMVFELYDGGRKIGKIEKYFIVK